MESMARFPHNKIIRSGSDDAGGEGTRTQCPSSKDTPRKTDRYKEDFSPQKKNLDGGRCFFPVEVLVMVFDKFDELGLHEAGEEAEAGACRGGD